MLCNRLVRPKAHPGVAANLRNPTTNPPAASQMAPWEALRRAHLGSRSWASLRSTINLTAWATAPPSKQRAGFLLHWKQKHLSSLANVSTAAWGPKKNNECHFHEAKLLGQQQMRPLASGKVHYVSSGNAGDQERTKPKLSGLVKRPIYCLWQTVPEIKYPGDTM